MVQYVDYDYYVDSFQGNDIPPDESFRKLACQASVFVREITRNRIDEDNVPVEVKDAVCAVCEVDFREHERISKSQSGEKEVRSENTDGYQVSYVTEGQDGQAREDVMWRKRYAAARPHLLHTGLLYMGCE